MKTKNLYLFAVGFFSLLLILILIVVPFFLFINHLWTAVSIVFGLIILGLIIYINNIAGYKLHKFYDYDQLTNIKKLHGQKFDYKKAEYPFSCGQTVIQMLIQKHGIIMSQDEILSLSGDKNLGTSVNELKYSLNKIFHEHKLPLKAKISYRTTYAQLFDAIDQRKEVIVLFINHFIHDGFSTHAHYPHFALLNYFNMSSTPKKNRVVLTTPMYGGEQPYTKGKYEGEIEIPFQEFQERFYMTQRFIHRLEYKPTRTKNILRNMGGRIVNFFFVFAFYIGLFTSVLKPGTAIIIQSTKKD